MSAVSDERVRAAWKRIEEALDAIVPGTSRSLGRGATDAEIARVEKHLGVALPEDVRASLRIHARTPHAVLCGVLAPDAIASEHAIRTTDWPTYRVPLAGDGGHFAIDLASAGAPEEQIVWRWRDGAHEKRASSWTELLENEASMIEAGEIIVEGDGDLVRREPPSRPSGLELERSFRFISQAPSVVENAPGSKTEVVVIEHNTISPPKS
jgi:cell wall assembly regulator SMI1